MSTNVKQFIETVARMKTEEEFGIDNAPPSEDWICTLSDLIIEARAIKKQHTRLVRRGERLSDLLSKIIENGGYLTVGDSGTEPAIPSKLYKRLVKSLIEFNVSLNEEAS